MGCCEPKKDQNSELNLLEVNEKGENKGTVPSVSTDKDKLTDSTRQIQHNENEGSIGSGMLPFDKKANYAQCALELINKIRANPPDFIPDIENAIPKIGMSKDRLIYAGKLKVSIKEGETAFREAIEDLKKMSPMEPLSLESSLCIPMPETEEDAKNGVKFKELVEQAKQHVSIEAYFKDCVRDPYTSVLLLIIDDNGKRKGKKRAALLNKKLTKIGINYADFGKKTFCAYYALAK